MTHEEILSMPAGREMRQALVNAGVWDASDKRDPSQDIAAAWEVIEKLKEHEEIVRVEWFPKDGNEDSCYEVVLEAVNGCEPYLYTKAETAPLAICRAALLAVMK